MRFNTLVAAAVSFSCALVASAANVTITAGAGGLVFNPSNVTANVGDQVVFSFINTHTVTQSSFGTPCTKLASGGFDSGPMTGSSATYIVKVNDTNPIWIMCSIPTHCSNGMVAAINAPTSGDLTFSNFQQLAEGKSITTTGTGTATTHASSTSSSSSSTSTTSKGAASPRIAQIGSSTVALAIGIAGTILGAVAV